MTSRAEWDVSLISSGGEYEKLVMTIPAPIAKALRAAGMNRAKVTVTDDGILARPFVGDPRVKKQSVIELPDAWKP